MRKFGFIAVVLVVSTVRAQDDPSGFVPLLNQARAQRGLAPVRHDPQAVAVAAINNQHQLARGLGHWHTGNMGQVAAVGMADARAALDAWTGSPSHAALIYAPDLVSVGYHQMGGVATASTQQSVVTTYVQPTYYYGPVYYYRRW